MFNQAIITYVTTICLCKSAASIPQGDWVRDRQAKLLHLVSRLGTQDDFGHVPQPFPFNDPSLFSNEEALQNFTKCYNQGYLNKDGVFLPYDPKTEVETRNLFHLFYFAKDFDSFYKIAAWAKKEMNPVQFIYALTSAVLHRSDLSSVSMPPIYEILPDYFVPSSVMNNAYRARLNGVEYRKFFVNNTGWVRGRQINYETFFQRDQDKFDHETRLSYYREDVTRSDFFFKYFKKLDVLLSSKIRQEQHYERVKEWYLTAFRWILTRYNLERYAVDLPPTEPLHFYKNLNSGYDPQMSDLYGRYFSKRPDGITLNINSEEFMFVERSMNNFLNGDYNRTVNEGQLSYNQLETKLSSPSGKNTLLTLYFGLMALMDRTGYTYNNMYSQGILLNDLTRMRDPVYYQILALINQLVESMESKRKPYSHQQLGFPGVEITDVKIEKLETKLEYFDFDVSNTIPGKGGILIASQFRINHKPFSIRIRIKSNVTTSATIKIFLGMQTDSLNRPLSLNQLRQSFTLMDTFQLQLKEGDNTIQRAPGQSELTSESLRMADIKKIINGDFSNFKSQCYYPSHLILPKGESYGKKFKLFFIVYPSENSHSSTRLCGREHLTSDTSRSIPFPVDKPWNPSALKQSNLKFIDAYIYHSH